MQWVRVRVQVSVRVMVRVRVWARARARVSFSWAFSEAFYRNSGCRNSGLYPKRFRVMGTGSGSPHIFGALNPQ